MSKTNITKEEDNHLTYLVIVLEELGYIGNDIRTASPTTLEAFKSICECSYTFTAVQWNYLMTTLGVENED